MKNNILLPVLGIGGALLAFKLIGKGAKDRAKEEAIKDIVTKPEGQNAISLLQAMNPSGELWLMWGDGTDEEAIFSTAPKVYNLNQTGALYKSLTGGRNLVEDLQSELDSSDFQKFMSLIKG